MDARSAESPVPVVSAPATRDVPVGATCALAAGCAAALAVACLLSPHEATHGPVVCPFRLATGLPCPGCGMTRAWVFLVHGDLSAAVAANPFALVSLPCAVVVVGLVVFAVVRRRPLPDFGAAIRSKPAVAVTAAWIVFGVVRAIAVLTGDASI